MESSSQKKVKIKMEKAEVKCALGYLASTVCYKYRLSNLHIHHRLCRKSPRSICRGMLHITQPVNHPTEAICTPCTIPELIEGQDRQIDHIYPLPERIYPLPLAHMIVLDRFTRGPLGTLPKVTYYYSHDYTQFP